MGATLDQINAVMSSGFSNPFTTIIGSYNNLKSSVDGINFALSGSVPVLDQPFLQARIDYELITLRTQISDSITSFVGILNDHSIYLGQSYDIDLGIYGSMIAGRAKVAEDSGSPLPEEETVIDYAYSTITEISTTPLTTLYNNANGYYATITGTSDILSGEMIDDIKAKLQNIKTVFDNETVSTSSRISTLLSNRANLVLFARAKMYAEQVSAKKSNPMTKAIIEKTTTLNLGDF